ncbi:MAG: Do family serine endopeptidase, partial [Steroidobacteraceae bacterium]|nr:Do family serine endopeptidase [Steroidobacteraceae bacterium]MDW8258266.1 Do family serine endopeptidase [Gammaproteobacteria bacterium]
MYRASSKPLLAVVTTLCLLAGPAGAQQTALPSAVDGSALPSLAPMVKRVAPAVVSIGVKGVVRGQGQNNPLFDDPFFRRFFDPEGRMQREREFESAGSGVIVDARQGHIVTNAHVIENAREITVVLQDGRELRATVVGTDTRTDLAVLKVAAEGLSQIALGDSSRLEVGDFVVAIGNPFGLQHTVTSGIVSALGRTGVSPAQDNYEDFIQTDASINPGNSGGALVNLRGELVGINSAILSRSGGNIGIGFAIPSNMARSVVEQIVKFGSVRRGVLGVSTAAVTPDIAQALGLATASGALVSQVIAGSAADKAGIKVGDVITQLNGRPIKSHVELRNAIGLLRVGDRVDLELLRDGKALRLAATIGESATAAAAAGSLPDAPSTPDLGPPHPALEGAQLV